MSKLFTVSFTSNSGRLSCPLKKLAKGPNLNLDLILWYMLTKSRCEKYRVKIRLKMPRIRNAYNNVKYIKTFTTTWKPKPRQL